MGEPLRSTPWKKRHQLREYPAFDPSGKAARPNEPARRRIPVRSGAALSVRYGLPPTRNSHSAVHLCAFAPVPIGGVQRGPAPSDFRSCCVSACLLAHGMAPAGPPHAPCDELPGLGRHRDPLHRPPHREPYLRNSARSPACRVFGGWSRALVADAAILRASSFDAAAARHRSWTMASCTVPEARSPRMYLRRIPRRSKRALYIHRQVLLSCCVVESQSCEEGLR